MLPGQQHSQAQAVAEALEHAREGVAGMVGCDSFEIVFTGGGTEANNLAILGSLIGKPPGHLITSVLEHDSVQMALESLTGSGWELEVIECGPDGVLDPDDVASRLRDDTRLVCLQHTNPVLGTVQPVGQVVQRCRGRGVPVHCDTTQSFGKMPVDVNHLGVDTAAISGHKFYGPKGSGAVYVRRGVALAPILYGESREMGCRPGPENIPACIGLGAAASLAGRCCGDAADSLSRLRDRLINGLRQVISPAPVVLCEESPRLPNTATLEMPCDAQQIQRSARQLVLATAQSGSPPDEFTRCLLAIGRNESQIGRTLRLSVGWTTSRESIDRTVQLLAEACDGVPS